MSMALASPPLNWVLGKSKAGAYKLEKKLNPLTKRNCFRVKACPFSVPDEPILRQALKEPVAFMGGLFAGVLRLDLNEDPLKEWVTKTVESIGISAEEIDGQGAKPDEEIPQQIEIE